jgi:hypothetical protein
MKRLAAIFILLLGAHLYGVAGADTEPQVTICHATASASNPYTSNTVDQSSIDDPNGHGTHPGDIIPAFDGYPGQNLDLLDILNNGCEIPCDVDAETTTECPPPTTDPPPPTTTEPPPTTVPPTTEPPPSTTIPPCDDECEPPPPPPPPPVEPCGVADPRPGCPIPPVSVVRGAPAQTG